MGIIYNANVEETELYTAYGMTVYGKINRYEWSIFTDRDDEDCLISLRITTKNGELINEFLGNNCIFYDNFVRTIDNFLYWIKTEQPDLFLIRKQIEKVLQQTDSIFNSLIQNRKTAELHKLLKAKQDEERKAKEEAKKTEIDILCRNKGLQFYSELFDQYIIKPMNERAKDLCSHGILNGKIKDYIEFAIKYPDNKDLQVVKFETIEECYQWIKNN